MSPPDPERLLTPVRCPAVHSIPTSPEAEGGGCRGEVSRFPLDCHVPGRATEAQWGAARSLHPSRHA